MRIGIDARLYGGEQAKGLGRYTEKLLEYLAKLDKENEYIIFVREKILLKNKRFHLVVTPWRWYSLAEQIWMPIKIWQSKVDIMHFPHFNVPFLYRGKFIVTIHDLILTHFPTERATTLGPLLYKIKQFGYRLTIRHAVKNAQKIITVSQHSKQDIIQQFNISPQKITVSYEAVDISPIPITQYLVPSPYLLYIGNAYPHKNLEILLDVLQELKRKKELDFKLVLVGKEDYFYKRLKQAAWAKNVDEDIIFLGFVPDKDLPGLYKNALAYIFPSKYEGFGLPGLEAMAYGIPVLASHSSSLPEILGQAALYFNPDNLYDIIRAIKHIRNKELREEFIQKGFVQVKKYSWQKLAEQTLEVYESIKNKN